MKIPAFDPLPSQYFIRLVSDSWVGCDLVLPVSFQHVLLPEMEMPFTNLMDLTPLPKSVLHNKKYEALYPKFETFNPIQTQLFHVLYHTNTPVLLGAPTGRLVFTIKLNVLNFFIYTGSNSYHFFP